ncbi:MAG: hypothetical protein CMF67_10505 [Magnetovibrio sp.]|nr:hypothetical protein [Magnetovibrio sp.]
MNVAVIGSGPSGLASSEALLARGIRVTIFDIGEVLPREVQDRARRLASLPVANWTKSDRAAMTANSTLRRAIPRKFLFGHEFAYGHDKPYLPLDIKNDHFAPSVAQGGYSTLWGAASLPVAECDMTGWPFGADELTPYYRKILTRMPLVGGEGTINEVYPFHTDHLGNLPKNRQAKYLLDDLRASERSLDKTHFVYGESRLAVSSSRCDPCGLCLSGCPRGAIFRTDQVLQSYIETGKISYRRGILVDEVDENGSKATLRYTDLNSGTSQSDHFDAIFIAAGVLGSSRILLRSKRVYDRSLRALQSGKFLIPILRRHATSAPWEEPSIALPQIFMEYKIPGFADNWFHVQVSSASAMMLEALGMRPGQERYWKRKLAEPFLSRLMIAWCGMHSDHSTDIAISLEHKNGCSSTPLLKVRSVGPDRSKKTAKLAGKALFRHGLKFNSWFVTPAMRLSQPGTGYHCGGTFPHETERSSEFGTDILGRPFNWTRVFLVDGSVLPSIPGNTLALTIMANAMRIADKAPIGRNG